MIHIIEDQQLLLDVLPKLLERLGHTSRSFTCPSDYFDFLASDKGQNEIPDVIFTDIVMPGMNGYQMMQKVLEKHPNQRFVVMSAYLDDNEQLVTPCMHLDKPFSFKSLQIILDSIDNCTEHGPNPDKYGCHLASDADLFDHCSWSCPRLST